MTKKIYSYFDDLDMEEVEGKVTQVPVEQVEELEEEDIIEIEAEPPEPVDEWEACLYRMEKHLNKSWIAIPRGNKLEILDIKTCSDEKFFEWLCYIWPPCKSMNHKPSTYSEYKYRDNALVNIANYYSAIKFPATVIGE